MAASYEVGDAVALTWAVRVAGVLTNATVVLTITNPAGVASTPTVTNPSTGNYAASFTATLNGLHHWRWVATGAVTNAESGTFTVGEGYCSLEDLKTRLGIDDTDDDVQLQQAIDAASQAIDNHTGTTFAAGTATTRLFRPYTGYEVWVDPFTDATGLVVKTGTDGTYTTTITSTDITPWPYNGVQRGAYHRLDVHTGALPYSSAYTRPTVQVTARWGYDYVPPDVSEACLIKAAHLFKRKDSPHGVAGTNDFGVVRISKFEDPDVVMLLAPYVVMPAGIA